MIIQKPGYQPPKEYVDSDGVRRKIFYTKTERTEKVYRSVDDPDAPPIVIVEEREIRDEGDFEPPLPSQPPSTGVPTDEERSTTGEQRGTEDRQIDGGDSDEMKENEKQMRQWSKDLKANVEDGIKKLHEGSPRNSFKEVVDTIGDYQKVSNDQEQAIKWIKQTANVLKKSIKSSLKEITEDSGQLAVGDVVGKIADFQAMSADFETAQEYMDEIALKKEKGIEKKLRTLVIKSASDFLNVLEDINQYKEIPNMNPQLADAYMDSALEKMERFIDAQMELFRKKPQDHDVERLIANIEFYVAHRGGHDPKMMDYLQEIESVVQK
jgi:hypothetical protein